jgi:methionyl-tRNA formyltransferase
LIQQRISDFQPDYLGSIYFRDIIPKKVLEVVKLRNFNAHPSLLPDYKGCFSSCWCLINGESKTGVTYHEMNEKIDEGDILWQVETPIYKTDTGFSLFQRLVSDVIINFRPFYKALLDGELSVRPMPKGGRYFKREAPYQGKINPEWPDQKIERFIRAMFFPPFEGATVEIKGQSYEVNSMKEYLDLRNRFDI